MIMAIFCAVGSKVWMEVSGETLGLPYFLEDSNFHDEMLAMLHADGACSAVEAFASSDAMIYVANHTGLLDRENDTFLDAIERPGNELVAVTTENLDERSRRWVKEIEERGLFAKLGFEPLSH